MYTNLVYLRVIMEFFQQFFFPAIWLLKKKMKHKICKILFVLYVKAM